MEPGSTCTSMDSTHAPKTARIRGFLHLSPQPPAPSLHTPPRGPGNMQQQQPYYETRTCLLSPHVVPQR